MIFAALFLALSLDTIVPPDSIFCWGNGPVTITTYTGDGITISSGANITLVYERLPWADSLPPQTVECCKFAFKRKQSKSYRFQGAIIPAGLSLISGAGLGVHEKIVNHWPVFHARFPNLNPQYWNPELSWKNKHWRDVPAQISDAKHVAMTIHNITLFTAGASITIGEKRCWWHYLADAGISLFFYSLGNAITYDWIY